MKNRIEKYYNMNTRLSFLSNRDISEMLRKSDKTEFRHWGSIRIINIDGINVFAKVIPVAKLYSDNLFNTSNLYNIPAYYHYDFAGSAGVNPWRELLSHIKLSNSVVNGECSGFPLLYHYRYLIDYNTSDIISGFKKMNKWGNNSQISKYLKDRISSKNKIVMFIEYIPNNPISVISKTPEFAEEYYNQSKSIVKYLKSKQIIHNDSSVVNYVIDNNNVYLTDFGTMIMPEFKLNNDEKEYLKRNKNMDYYYVTYNLFTVYRKMVFANTEIVSKYSLNNLDFIEMCKVLINNIDDISNNTSVSSFHVKFIKNNQELIIKFADWMNKFMKSSDRENYYLDEL